MGRTSRAKVLAAICALGLVAAICALGLVAGFFVGSDRLGWWGSDESAAQDVSRGTLLFAVRWDPLRNADDVAHDLLVDDGWDVTVRVVDAPDSLLVADTSGYDVVVLSSSIQSMYLTELGAAPVPIVTWEPYHHDDMGSFTENGRSPGFLSFEVDGAHPLAADLGLDGPVTFSTTGPSSAGGGEPVADVVPIGVFPDGSIGWYELPAGSLLTDASTAPACRIGLPFNDKSSMLTGITADGADILVHSVRYAAGGCSWAVETTTTTTSTTPSTTSTPTTTTIPSTSAPEGVPQPEGATPRAIFVVADDGHAALLVNDGYTRVPDRHVSTSAPVVAAMAAGSGWWTVTAEGLVEANDDAVHHGDLDGVALNAPIVAASATPTGEGYWLVASDGGVFAFGDAGFHGSLGGLRLNGPIVTAVATTSGEGYWLVASDGGVFAFGDAGFHGSLGALTLNAPIASGTVTTSGEGYWLVASDGGVFAFGDAGFHGSEADSGSRWVAAAPHLAGHGYTLVAANGTTSVHGDAQAAFSVLDLAEHARPVDIIVLTG